MLSNKNYLIFEDDDVILAQSEEEHKQYSQEWLAQNSLNCSISLPPVLKDKPMDQIALPLPVEETKQDEDKLLALAKQHAWNDTKKYFLVYTIADGSFQASEDAILAKLSGKFAFEADPTFSHEEQLLAFQVYGIGYSLYHLMLDTALRYQERSIKTWADVWEIITDAIKFGLQFMGFYLFDKPFPIDWESAEETLPNIFMVCLCMSLLCYFMDVAPSLIWSYCRGEEAEQRKHILKVNLGPALGVGIGTAGWLLPYYLPLQDRIGLPGYIIKRCLEGSVANLAALPFVYQSALVDRKEQVRNGELELKEDNTEEQRVAFCTRATNYFGSWLYRKKREEGDGINDKLIVSGAELAVTPSNRQ